MKHAVISGLLALAAGVIVMAGELSAQPAAPPAAEPALPAAVEPPPTPQPPPSEPQPPPPEPQFPPPEATPQPQPGVPAEGPGSPPPSGTLLRTVPLRPRPVLGYESGRVRSFSQRGIVEVEKDAAGNLVAVKLLTTLGIFHIKLDEKGRELAEQHAGQRVEIAGTPWLEVSEIKPPIQVVKPAQLRQRALPCADPNVPPAPAASPALVREVIPAPTQAAKPGQPPATILEKPIP